MAVSLGGRRSARERALELLYESELKEQPVKEILAELPLGPLPYACTLAVGVDEQRARIDDMVGRHAIDWKLDRMPVVDRALLRMATYELGWCLDVPTSVVISEAVELAKQYSTDESSGFVNGLLAAIAHELRPAEGGPAEVARPRKDLTRPRKDLNQRPSSESG